MKLSKRELAIYQHLRRLRHFDPVLYGIILVTVAFMVAGLAWVGMVAFLLL